MISFILRSSLELREALKTQARERGVSFNQFCIQTLASSLSSSPLPAPYAVLVAQIKECYAIYSLIGIVLYGSQARGEAHDNSDCDILLVCASSQAITRSLYRLWDDSFSQQFPKVQISIVSLPKESNAFTPLWAAVAVDAIILWEESWLISRYLISIRQAIASAVYTRIKTHGQFYWKEHKK
jgi:hypothetical protein